MSNFGRSALFDNYIVGLSNALLQLRQNVAFAFMYLFLVHPTDPAKIFKVLVVRAVKTFLGTVQTLSNQWFCDTCTFSGNCERCGKQSVCIFQNIACYECFFACKDYWVRYIFISDCLIFAKHQLRKNNVKNEILSAQILHDTDTISHENMIL
jgi:hypothetical protein